MGKNYDASVDYMQKIQQAVNRGDMEQAAYYEEKRNEKIRGEGLSQYALTHDYEAYLPKTTAQRMEQVLQKLHSRQPFSYDPQEDQLYARYKDRYSKAGALAREDAAAQAASLTGGYGNSYGQTAGQEAYDRELDRLTSLVPELYDQAREDYDREGQEILAQYNRLAEDLQRQQENAQRLDREEQDRLLAKEELAYKQQKEEQEKAYSLALSMLKEGLMPSDSILGKSGIDKSDADKLYAANLPKDKTTASAGKSSGTTGKTGTASNASKNDKTLTNTMWDKLRTTYQKGAKAEDLSDFLQLRSMLLAQGYDVAAFDIWARDAFGKDYTTGGQKVIDRQSVLALGYGPIDDDRLAELLAAGEIEQYTRGDSIYYRRANKSPTPVPKSVMK